MMAGLGWGRLSWGWGIQGKLEKRGVYPDTEPTTTTSEEEKKDEHQGMAANIHYHPDLRSFPLFSVFVSSVLKAPSAAVGAEQHLRGRMQVCDVDPQLWPRQITKRRLVQRQWERRMAWMEEEKGRGLTHSDDYS